MPGFLKSLCVNVGVSAPRLFITAYMKRSLNNWLNKLYCFLVSIPHLPSILLIGIVIVKKCIMHYCRRISRKGGISHLFTRSTLLTRINVSVLKVGVLCGWRNV